MLTAPDPVTYTEPVDDMNESCDFVNQAAVDADFAAWVIAQTALIDQDGGCDPQIANNSAEALIPVLCEGGSVTVTWTITDLCETLTASAVYTLVATEDIVVTCSQSVNLPVCTPLTQIEEAYAAWVSGFSYTGGCNVITNIDDIPMLPVNVECIGANLSFTYLVEDDCGSDQCTSTFIVVPDTEAPTLITPLTNLEFACQDDVIIPEPVYEDNCEGEVDVFCEVTNNGACNGYEFPVGDTEICFWAVDECGNASEPVCITITVDPCEFCTMTQGYYGNEGGLYCNGETTIELITGLLSSGDMVIGVPANNKTFTVPSENAQCVIDILPGGGPAAVLPGINSCDNPGPLVGNNGRLRNNLLAQTITLDLNMRLDADLAGLVFESAYFYTLESTGCDDPNANPIPGTELYFTMPQCIMDAFGGQPSVADIYYMANQALGGNAVVCSLGDITSAIGVINDALDECRFIYFSEPAYQPQTSSPDVNLNVTPNPFRDVVEISFNLKSDSKVTIDIYNIQGVKVATIYEGEAKAGFEYTHKFTPANNQGEQVFLVVLKTMFGTTTKRIINTY